VCGSRVFSNPVTYVGSSSGTAKSAALDDGITPDDDNEPNDLDGGGDDIEGQAGQLLPTTATTTLQIPKLDDHLDHLIIDALQYQPIKTLTSTGITRLLGIMPGSANHLT